MRSRFRAVALLALGLLPAGCGSVDWHRAIEETAGNACRTVDNCSVVCDDGSTLDGRPVHARCRR